MVSVRTYKVEPWSLGVEPWCSGSGTLSDLEFRLPISWMGEANRRMGEPNRRMGEPNSLAQCRSEDREPDPEDREPDSGLRGRLWVPARPTQVPARPTQLPRGPPSCRPATPQQAAQQRLQQVTTVPSYLAY